MKKLLVLGITLLTLASCTDKNVDDYRRDRVNQNYAKAKAKEGLYRGLLILDRDGTNLGEVALEIKASMTTKENPEGTGTETHAVILGKISHQSATLLFNQGTYDDATGTIVFTMTLQEGKVLKVFGTITGNKIKASIVANDLYHYGATMELVKDAPPTTTPDSTPPPILTMEKYVGKLGDIDVVMTLQLSYDNPAQNFYYLFVSNRTVQVSLDFKDFRIGTDAGNLELDTQKLTATFIATSGGDSYKNKFDCNRIDKDTWSCSLYNSASNNTLKGTLKSAQ